MNTITLNIDGKILRLTAEFQPIIYLPQNKIFRYEALARFYNTSGVLVHTKQTIEKIEKCNAINEVTDFIFSVICKIIKIKSSITISFNLSHLLFNDTAYLDTLYKMCLAYNVRPQNIEIEISEKITRQQLIDGVHFLSKAKAYGFMISLDDFGAGSLEIDSLNLFDFDTIKIDRSLVDGIGEDLTKAKRLKTLLNKLIPLGTNIICEGVETAIDLNQLNKYSHIGVQGYIFYRPLTLNQLKLLEGF